MFPCPPLRAVRVIRRSRTGRTLPASSWYNARLYPAHGGPPRCGLSTIVRRLLRGRAIAARYPWRWPLSRCRPDGRLHHVFTEVKLGGTWVPITDVPNKQLRAPGKLERPKNL